ncbi:MAG: hypothetical protein PWP23_456 [Candidatus Sumerlaeota bacterium]|nr:hypothetical protein [Candidatus Sumerlaeota bacterium]
MKRIKAFTLIELLIVVAIIAILAAIAVPNFLEAQVRSKVSRVRSDLRTLATAIEAYTVDYNHPPPEARGTAPNTGPFAPRTIDGFPNQTGILTPALSTPVSYITNSDIRDVFFSNEGSNNTTSRPDVQLFTWKAYDWEWLNKASSDPIGYNEGTQLTGDEFRQFYGAWRLFSVGPDRDWDNVDNGTHFSSPSPVGMPYDPSNGTISAGSIVRSQAEPEQKTWKVF